MTTHYFYIVPELGRFKVIRDLLLNTPKSIGMVFCQSKKEVIALTKQLSYQFPVSGLHGNTPKPALEKVLLDWDNQALRLLITTFNAGQGLGSQQMKFIFHYQLPPNADAYLQAFKEMPSENGTIVTLISPNQEAFLKRLQEVLDFELLKHPGCSVDFMDAEALADINQSGKKDLVLGKQFSSSSRTPNTKSKGNTPNVPSRHV